MAFVAIGGPLAGQSSRGKAGNTPPNAYRRSDGRAVVLSKNGKDFHKALSHDRGRRAAMPCASCIIDAEGFPDFRALVGGQYEEVAWCFDLIEVDGRDMRSFPLVTPARGSRR